MDKFYHGSSKLFDKFDLSHAFEGAGRCKFGFGIYVTSVYTTAAHYSAAKGAEHNYVYTVEVPEPKEGNYIAYKQPVHPTIVEAVAKKLGCPIPDKAVADAKFFREFIESQFDKKRTIAAKRQAAELLHSVGVCCIIWPHNWKKGYEGEIHCAIFSDADIRITAIDEVELDSEEHFKSIIKHIKP